MFLNPLFNFMNSNQALHVITSLQKSGFEVQDLQSERENKSIRRYFKLVLPKKNLSFSCQSEKYVVLDHHLSIDEYIDPRSDALPPYHYTATLIFDDIKYTLHVYFPEKREQYPIVSLKKELDLGAEVVTVHELLRLQFIQAASSESLPLISNIKRAMFDKIEMIETECMELDQKAAQLSMALPSSYPDYIAILKKLVDTFYLLNSLHSHRSYQGKLDMCSQMLHHYQQEYNKIQSNDVSSTDASVEMPQSAEDLNQSKTSDAITSSFSVMTTMMDKPRRMLDPEITKLVEEFDKLCNLFDKKTTASNKEFLKSFPALYRQIKDMCLYSDDSNVEIQNVDNLRKLLALDQAALQKLKKLIPDLIERKSFETIKKFSDFENLLTSNYLNLALERSDHELLNFVLAHGNFAINTQPVSVGGKKYSSAIEYCISNDAFSCLALLIEHGASIMHRDIKSNLPFAHCVLSNRTHRLYGLLNKTGTTLRAVTVDSVDFYNQLIAAMRHCVTTDTYATSSLLFSNRDIEAFILLYEIQKDLLLCIKKEKNKSKIQEIEKLRFTLVDVFEKHGVVLAVPRQLSLPVGDNYLCRLAD